MPIKTKDNTATLPPENEGALQFRNNPEIQKRLDAYKSANASDAAYFTRVVAEAPARAVDMLLYKDMQRHESEMRLVEKQLPQAKAFYDAQTPEVQARIDQRLEGTQPFYKDKAFVGEVLREMNRKNRQILTTPKTGMAMAG
ncbi:MAG: hypothetical protein ABIQ12_04210 [Opitutaceae bacterium]